MKEIKRVFFEKRLERQLVIPKFSNQLRQYDPYWIWVARGYNKCFLTGKYLNLFNKIQFVEVIVSNRKQWRLVDKLIASESDDHEMVPKSLPMLIKEAGGIKKYFFDFREKYNK